jgi:DNA-binding XRE family transcriptional regulator
MKIKALETFEAIRITKGFSKRSLARTMGVNQSVVSNIESGHYVRPATAKKACEALGEPISKLFFLKEDN